MKALLILALSLSPALAGEEPKKKPEPITISAPSTLASYDQETGKFKYEKGADAEQVAEILMKELIAVSNKLRELEVKCGPQPAPFKDSKKTEKKK